MFPAAANSHLSAAPPGRPLPRLPLRVALLAALMALHATALTAQSSQGGTEPPAIVVPRELSAPQAPPSASLPGDAAAGEAGEPGTPGVPGTPGALPGAAAPQASAQDLLAEARRLREEGQLREAFSVYRLWLERNPGDPSFAAVLGEATSWAPDAILASDLLGRFAGGIQEPELREEFLLRQARLLVAIGRYEEAQRLLSTPGYSVERAYLRAVLLYEQGELEGCLELLRETLSDPEVASGDAATQEIQARMYLIMAQAYGALGREGEAESLYLLLHKRYGSTAIAPGALLEYQRFLTRLGRDAEAASLGSELRQRFPDSPEASLALSPEASESGADQDPRVVYASSPLRLLPAEIQQPLSSPSGPEGEALPAPAVVPPAASPDAHAPATAAPAIPPTPTDAPQTEAPAVQALVQTGSFRDRENAVYMVRDLKGAGFAAEILEKDLDGRVFYRVVIGPAMAAEEAQRLMLRLKVAGFEGFLLFLD